MGVTLNSGERPAGVGTALSDLRFNPFRPAAGVAVSMLLDALPAYSTAFGRLVVVSSRPSPVNGVPPPSRNSRPPVLKRTTAGARMSSEPTRIIERGVNNRPLATLTAPFTTNAPPLPSRVPESMIRSP